MVVSTQPTEKEKEKEKEVTKKSTSSARSSSIFKVKFKKDDFLSKKTHGKCYSNLIHLNIIIIF